MQIRRNIINELLRDSGTYSLLTIVGPRFAGKTTLARSAFLHKAYANLEAPETKKFATLDPRGFLAEYPDGGIFDEVQNVPKLLPYLQEKNNRTSYKNQFILLASQQYEFVPLLQQTLQVRTGLLTLLPLTFTEVKSFTTSNNIDEYLLRGFLPGVYSEQLDLVRTQRNYLHAYLERDISPLINARDLGLLQRLLRLCAANINKVIDAGNFAKELDISVHMVEQWFNILEAASMIFRLPACSESFGKRAHKGTKLYFVDVGVAAYLLDIENIEQMQADPMRHALIVNLVVLELLKYRVNAASDHHLYYYQGSNAQDADILYYDGAHYLPIMVISAETLQNSDIARLEKLRALVNNKATGFIIYLGETEQKQGNMRVLNYKNSMQIFAI